MTLYGEIDRQAAWLKPPGPIISLPPKQAANTRRALTRLRRQLENATPEHVDFILNLEAYASSLIENIDEDPRDPDNLTGRLRAALDQALEHPNVQNVTDWHLTLMAGHPDPRMNPGKLREVNVSVGTYVAPTYDLVPGHMEQFNDWAQSVADPLMLAVWGHRYFETIHPFADGNGRTGRLIVTAALKLAIPTSAIIWQNRRDYYYGLNQANWQDWANWTLDVIRHAATLGSQLLKRDLPDKSTYEYLQAVRQSATPPADPHAFYERLLQQRTR